MPGKLYLVSTPIGNYDDITLRALNVLKDCDIIICEEFKEAKRLLSHYQIQKELYSINEHNEKENSQEILYKLLEGKNLALISDCGTPLFSDPGSFLTSLCISQKIEVVPVPGANSLLPALIMSGFDTDKFYFAGWLSPKKEERRVELLKLKAIKEVLVIYDTPYRLKSVLLDIVKIIGKNVNVCLAYNITLKTEKYYHCTAQELLTKAESQIPKGEYVLLINNK